MGKGVHVNSHVRESYVDNIIDYMEKKDNYSNLKEAYLDVMNLLNQDEHYSLMTRRLPGIKL